MLARSLRSGTAVKDLKPNAATRDLLNVRHAYESVISDGIELLPDLVVCIHNKIIHVVVCYMFFYALICLVVGIISLVVSLP